MKNLTFFLALIMLNFAFLIMATAETLFSDDFEEGLRGMWVFSDDLGGEGDWNVVKEGNNHILQKTGSGWMIISVDDVGGVDGGKEVWARVRMRCDKAAADEGAEFGLLINPANAIGNWYFTVRATSGQASFDELGITWHNPVPYPDWSVGDWHQVKLAVIDNTFYGKVWPDGDDEPADWTNQITLTSHLDQDGVGFGTDTNEVSFDDLIVADAEDSLVPMAVSRNGKLTTTWGEIKY